MSDKHNSGADFIGDLTPLEAGVYHDCKGMRMGVLLASKAIAEVKGFRTDCRQTTNAYVRAANFGQAPIHSISSQFCRQSPAQTRPILAHPKKVKKTLPKCGQFSAGIRIYLQAPKKGLHGVAFVTTFLGVKIMRKTVLMAALAVSSLMAGPAIAANLVANGSFEQGNFVGGSFGFPNAQQVLPGNSTTLPGWTTSNSELAWARNGQAGILSQDGIYNLDLTGFFDTTGSYAGVSQTLATVAGNKYRLSFYAGNYTPQGGVAAGIIASTGGTTQTYSIPPTGTPDPGGNSSWTNFGFDFTASGANTLLSFNGTNFAGSHATFIGLDNVAVNFLSAPGGVPEPASWALMIAGFGLTGSAMRRRAKVQAVLA